MTEEQIIDIFKDVGPVVNFKWSLPIVASLLMVNT